MNPGGGQRLLLGADALHFGNPGVGIQLDWGEKLQTGLCDPVFHSQPVEQRALGLVLAEGDFNQAPDGMGTSRRSELFRL